jgi:aldehyde dehydrogenase (NAD+)
MTTQSETSPSELVDQITSLRAVFASGRTRGIQWRRGQLEGIERLVDERENDIANALAQDLGRERAEAWLGARRWW